MILADHLLPYSHDTLLLVCDRASARFLHAHDREVKEVDTIENDRLDPVNEHPPGGEHMAVTRDEHYHEHEAEVFYKKLAERLFELKQQMSYEDLILVVPGDDKNLLADALHEDVRQTLQSTLPKLLTNLGDAEVMEHVDQHRRG